MRDQFYRNLCMFPTEYDKVINWIRDNNSKAAALHGETPEDFAVRVVHSNINTVLFGQGGVWSTTGMCLAVRASTNPESESYMKVILAIHL